MTADRIPALELGIGQPGGTNEADQAAVIGLRPAFGQRPQALVASGLQHQLVLGDERRALVFELGNSEGDQTLHQLLRARSGREPGYGGGRSRSTAR